MNDLVEMLDGQMTRPKMAALERELAKLPQIKPEMRHYWAPGIYTREIWLPAGSCTTGQVHLHPHLSIVLGDITVVTTEGRERITGYQTVLAPAGIKRAVLAHSDTWWTTVHPNPDNERDLEKLAARFVVQNFEEFDALLELTP